MRIGIMLRAIDENQGIGIYTRNVIPRLLRLDRENDYFLIYRNSQHVGRFEEFHNVTELSLDLPTKPLWDQLGVPRLARKHDLDLIFNTKFTVPLFTGRRTIMTLHGSDWFTHPEHYHPLDIAYVRAFMPRYCKKADHLIANSEMTKTDFVEILRVPREKITTIPLAANECFRPVTDQAELDRVRERYALPRRFILSVTKYFRQKNVPVLIRAYERLPRELRSHLVLVGRGVERYRDDLGLDGTVLGSEIVTTGWIEQEDLPAVYSMADLFAFPSRYESFGIPVLEAMACGCPVVAADSGALPEITNGAAKLVAPDDSDALSNTMRLVLENELERDAMRGRGFDRARHYSWAEHARRTLEVLRRYSRSI